MAPAPRQNLSNALGAGFGALALAVVLGGSAESAQPTPSPPRSPASAAGAAGTAPAGSKEANPLEELAKGLGIPGGVLVILGGGWFLFTRGKPIQENKKAWKELTQNIAQPPSSEPTTPAMDTGGSDVNVREEFNTTLTDFRAARDVVIYQTFSPPQLPDPNRKFTPFGVIESHRPSSLASNPFGDRGRIRDPLRFFDRRDLLRQIFDELGRGNSLSLVGETQIGKSSILEQIRQRGPHELKIPTENIISIDMQVVENENDFFQALCRQLRLTRTLRGHALDRALKGKRYVLCIDEIEKMTDPNSFSGHERTELRGLADGNDASLTLVIASRSSLDSLFEDDPRLTSPLSGLCGAPIRVPPFTLETTIEFLEARLQGHTIQFSPDEIEGLWRITQGHPAKLQAAAAELYRKLTSP